MGAFFRPFLCSLILSLGAASSVFAQDPTVEPAEADFEAVEQELSGGDAPPLDPELDGPGTPPSDGVEPYEPTPEEPFPEDLTPVDPQELENLEPAPEPGTEPASEDEADVLGEALPDAAQVKKEEWVSPYHSKSWPGSFMAVRLGFGAGNVLVPQFSAGGGVRARAPLSQIAPYAGIELGATRKRWGGSFSVEGTMIGPQAEFLSAPPVHVFVSLNGYYAPKGSRFRWALGLRPFIHYGMESPSGQFLHLRGYGFHLAAHRLLKRTPTSAIEGYVTLSMDRFTAAVSGIGDDDSTVPMGDLIGARTLSAAFMIQAGIQFALLK